MVLVGSGGFMGLNDTRFLEVVELLLDKESDQDHLDKAQFREGVLPVAGLAFDVPTTGCELIQVHPSGQVQA